MVKRHPDQLSLRKDLVMADVFSASHLAVAETVQHADLAVYQSEMVPHPHVAATVVSFKSEAAKVVKAVNDICHLLQAAHGFKPSVPIAPDLKIYT